jgi:hypothetical protein
MTPDKGRWDYDDTHDPGTKGNTGGAGLKAILLVRERPRSRGCRLRHHANSPDNPGSPLAMARS